MPDNYDCGEVDCDDYKDGKCTYQGHCPNGPLHLVKTAKIVMVSPRDLRYRCGHCGANAEGWYRYCAHCGYKFIIGDDE